MSIAATLTLVAIASLTSFFVAWWITAREDDIARGELAREMTERVTNRIVAYEALQQRVQQLIVAFDGIEAGPGADVMELERQRAATQELQATVQELQPMADALRASQIEIHGMHQRHEQLSRESSREIARLTSEMHQVDGLRAELEQREEQLEIVRNEHARSDEAMTSELAELRVCVQEFRNHEGELHGSEEALRSAVQELEELRAQAVSSNDDDVAAFKSLEEQLARSLGKQDQYASEKLELAAELQAQIDELRTQNEEFNGRLTSAAAEAGEPAEAPPVDTAVLESIESMLAQVEAAEADVEQRSAALREIEQTLESSSKASELSALESICATVDAALAQMAKSSVPTPPAKPKRKRAKKKGDEQGQQASVQSARFLESYPPGHTDCAQNTELVASLEREVKSLHKLLQSKDGEQCDFIQELLGALSIANDDGLGAFAESDALEALQEFLLMHEQA